MGGGDFLGKFPQSGIGTENPIHNAGASPGIEPGSIEVKDREETTEPTWLKMFHSFDPMS